MMQKWDQAVITWNLSHGRSPVVFQDRKTNILVPGRDYTFRLTALCTESLLDGEILFNLAFSDYGEKYERRCRPSPFGEEAILNHLARAKDPAINLARPSVEIPLSRVFTLLYPRRGECCERMLILADGIIELLGIEDETKELFANFKIERRTFVKKGKQWIPYASYLRGRLGLPDPSQQLE